MALAASLPAAAAAQQSADPSEPLGRAVALHAEGQIEPALERLEPLRDGPLGAHVGLLEARWLRELGRLEAARSALVKALLGSGGPSQATPLPADVRSRLQAELAQLEIASGALGKARAAQQDAWESTSDPDRASALAFELAELFDARGLYGEALSLYRTVWERWPRSQEAESAYARSTQIERETGADRPEVGSLVSHLQTLRAIGRCETALQILPDVQARRDKSEAQDLALREERAACLFRTRQYREAAERYASLSSEIQDEVRAIEAAILSARAQARAGRLNEGVRELSAIAQKAPEPHATRARYLVALLIGDRDARSARRLLERVAGQREDAGLAREASWQLAWDAVQRGAIRDALRHLEPLRKGSIDDIEVQRARYWYAVVLESRDAAAGRAGLTEIAESIPLSYYGMLAAERLGSAFQLVRPVLQQEPTGGPPPAAVQRALWLRRAGLHELARDELRSWRLDGPLTREERIAGAKVLHDLGDHFDATRLIIDGFGPLLERGIDPAWRAAWIAAWPRPFDEPVANAVREFKGDPALVYAIMREESLYRPQVQSPAGARGLMQLVPPTARRIAASLGVEGFDPESLYNPEVNVRFGTYYLNKLAGEFEGSRQLVVAAYNAGPEAVSGWQARGGAEPLDRFVDSVPYDETRRYLRRVLRSYRIYRALYADEIPAMETSADPGSLPAQPARRCDRSLGRWESSFCACCS